MAVKRKKKTRSRKKIVRAFGYVRVSKEEEIKGGFSLEMQRKKIEAYAELRDLELIEVFEDDGYSGGTLERPGLSELLEHVRCQEAEALIVYRLDRLSRRTRDLLHLVEDVFVEGNTRFLSLSESIDTRTAMGKFFLTLMGALAQMERETASERIRDALALKKKKGEWLGAVPLGYELGEGGKLVKKADEFAVLKKIKRMRRSGKGFREIARCLNRDGVATKRGGKWHDSTVRYLLKN